MHKLMVMSAVYRQSSSAAPATAEADPENHLFSRMRRKRLEGEALRDAMLAVSGQLNLKAGGPGIYPELPAEMNVPRGGWPVTADPAERNRRSSVSFRLDSELFDRCCCAQAWFNTWPAPQAPALLPPGRRFPPR